MPRIERGVVEGCIYHVLNRGNGKQVVFHKDRDYWSFVDLLREAKKKYPVNLYAYCLMPNHFHLVLAPVRADELSRLMQWLMTSHVRRYHQHYGSSGHVWQGRFKSFVVQEDSHLLNVLRYVEGNPVRAALVESAKDWTWSSHEERTGRIGRLLLDDPPLTLPANWNRYVDEPLNDHELERLRRSVVRQSPYGTPAWQAETAEKFGLESTLRPRGRPRKTE